MVLQLPSTVKKLHIHTGNVLNLNEVKKKVGQKLTDELVECLQITVAEWQASNLDMLSSESVQIKRSQEDSYSQLDGKEDRKDLKVGIKIFLPVTAASDNSVEDALTRVLKELNTPHVETLVLAQAGRQAEGVTSEQQMHRMQSLWEQMQAELDKNTVLSGGVSDMDTDLFIQLHSQARVKPGIVQINLASCCVVPPALQAFAKEQGVQLLTHSDPLEVLPEAHVQEIFGLGWRVGWVLRWQVHVKCRGVLASKGYMACVERD